MWAWIAKSTWRHDPSTSRFQSVVVVDCKNHLLGRLASTVAKELLNGQVRSPSPELKSFFVRPGTRPAIENAFEGPRLYSHPHR